MIGHGILLLTLISAPVLAQQEYVGKPFDSVYSILSPKYIVSEGLAENPPASAIKLWCPFQMYELFGFHGTLVLYLDDARMVDSVLWSAQYASHGGRLGDYEIENINNPYDGLKRDWEKVFGESDEEERNDFELKYTWDKIKQDDAIKLYLTFTSWDITAIFTKQGD